MKRRTVLGMLVAAASMAGAGVVAIPALLAGLSPAFQPRRKDNWRAVGPLADFEVGAVAEGTLETDPTAWPRTLAGQAVFVWRPNAQRLVVFSQSCTDLGCPLHYEQGSACYFCPCHGGIFSQDGGRLAGPVKRPMYRYRHRVRGELLEVDVTSVPPAV